jgi:hypothetical protein
MIGGRAALMNTTISNTRLPISDMETGVKADFSLEIEPQGQGKLFRLPVQVKDLAPEGVILEVLVLPHGVKVETLLHQEGIIHMAGDGFSKETQLHSKVVWIRQGDRGSSHFLLGLDLERADFRSRRSLESLIARPKDISDLWTYWDQVQTKPAPSDGRIMFYVGAGALLGGMGLQFSLPDTYNALATILTFFGIYMIAGKCLWNWWRGRSIPKEC